MIAVFALMYVSVVNASEAQVAGKLSPNDMVKSNSTKTYQPINHEADTTFILWKKQIKANLVKKTSSREKSKK